MTTGERERLRRYAHLLLEANRSMNLVSVRDADELWDRHILDSLTLMPHLGEARSLADIGSGGGLPGIPVAILRPDLPVTLIEATAKKARFLEWAAAELGLAAVSVINDRIENVGRDPGVRESFDAVTGRALAPLNVFLELASPLCRVGGEILAMKGEKAAEELAASQYAMEILSLTLMPWHQSPGESDGGGVILPFKKTAPTPARYPRKAGIPAKRPLANP